MLERTAKCLETGNLRRIIPGSKNLMRSRRMLHSSFWSHGATELELSPLWSALVYRPDALDEQDEGRAQAPSISGGPFLDFLYPSGAMKIIRQFSSWAPDTQDNRRLRAGFARLGQRLYTSISEANRIASSGRPHSTILEDHQVEPKSVYINGADAPEMARPYVLLEAIFGGLNQGEYDEAWRLYESTDSSSRQDRELTSRLYIYLSSSKRKVDALRMSVLLQHLREAFTLGDDYVALIRQLLFLKRRDSAILVHDDVLNTSQIPWGSDILLADLLSNEKWNLAYGVWIGFRSFRTKHEEKRKLLKAAAPQSDPPPLNYDPWNAVYKLPNLADMASRIAKHADASSSLASQEHPGEMILFAGQVVFKTLMALAGLLDVDKGKFYNSLNWLRVLNANSSKRYERLISQLFKCGHSHLAVRCYRQYRKSLTPKISQFVLNEVTNIFYHHLSVIGMKQVLDDWLRYYGRPPPAVYRKIMPMFASIGDATTVNALFEQYVIDMARSGLIIRWADDFGPLLHVHAVRGEPDKVREVFTRMENDFGLKPNVKSWNILINACGRVKDVDGAQEAFHALVSSGLQPDSYTYGTLMGICTIRGDSDKVIELYQMARKEMVIRTIPMINCLVLSHIQEDRLAEAEEVCLAALKIELTGSRTRMWNYLVNSYGLRRDLKGVHRILGLMKDAGVEWDEATYSALMQAFAMKKQPDRAYVILKEMMPKAGIVVKDYHYALVMGGYIANTEVRKVPEVYNRMLNSGRKLTSSTRLMALKAAAIQDQRLLAETGSEDAYLEKAEKYFLSAITSTDRQEVSGSLRKGVGGMPLDIAAQTSYFAFMIFVYGQRHAFNRVDTLYERYLESIPEERRDEPPVEILSALMVSNLNKESFDAVQKLWDLAFRIATRRGQRTRRDLGVKDEDLKFETQSDLSVLRKHRWDLTRALSMQILSLTRQGKFDAIEGTVEAVERAGFSLDQKNWNLYVQVLIQNKGYSRAFELCETKLMDRWTGWNKLRWRAPVRNRLSVELRAQRMQPEHSRPFYRTLMYLAKAYMNIRDAAMESHNAQLLLDSIRRDCPRTVQALETMVRDNNETERAILSGSSW